MSAPTAAVIGRPMLTALLLLTGVAGTSASVQEPSLRSPQGKPGTITLTYLGAAGWEITDGTTVVLVDPYISRNAYPPATDTLAPDRALVDRVVPRADYILVHHTHGDHAADVPYIASRTGARVIGTPSTINLMRAYGIPAEQLFPVRGGMDMPFDDLSIRVIPGLHHGTFYNPSVIPGTVKRPVLYRSLAEGGSLMYLIRLANHEILTMGSMAFIEREVEGLRPDIALVGAGFNRLRFYQYTDTYLRAIGYPKFVLPTHWDNFARPYGAPQRRAVTDKVLPFFDEVRSVSPDSRVIGAEHLMPIVIDGESVRVVGESRGRVIEAYHEAVERARRRAPPPGSESGLVSDFDAGTLTANFGVGWDVGRTRAAITPVSDGAIGSAGAMRIAGEVPSGQPWWVQAGARFSPGSTRTEAANLSSWSAVSFWARGDGRTYQVRFDSNDYTTFLTFEAGPSWQEYTLRFEDFEMVGHDVVSLSFITQEPGTFSFDIDDVRFR